MFDLAVGFGVIGTILYRVDVALSDHECFVYFVVLCPGDEHFYRVTDAANTGFEANRDINAFWLAFPDIHTLANVFESLTLCANVDAASDGYNTGFITFNLGAEAFASLQLDNVEVTQRSLAVVAVDDSLVVVVVVRNMHG